MARTGPQRYPGASTAAWYQDDFPGSPMEVNVVVLHTTEGTSLPSYGGGGSAPNLTARPDFAAKRLVWFQHFDIDVSSRALRNLSGGVETNTLNVCQVELVGTCDPTTHQRWQAAGVAHIYWPEAPDWALRDVAAFLRWMNAEHGVPLVGPSRWPAYPSSYGSAGGQRMSGAQWTGFSGVCGHMHVPENDHGDPGAIDFPKLIALAKGSTTPSEEDDMALSAEDKAWIEAAIRRLVPVAVLNTDNVLKNPNPATADENPYIALATAIGNIEILARRTEGRVIGLKAPSLTDAQVGALAAAVAAHPLLADLIATKVADKLASRLAS
ncbi:hypothetical protein [Streptomyces sp. NPDC053367]|uniref:hypothetical protein n=1 Tax=Streptomyces sp. NPDC053367 TaxID=3365700 RepID=UPI0037CF2E1B